MTSAAASLDALSAIRSGFFFALRRIGWPRAIAVAVVVLLSLASVALFGRRAAPLAGAETALAYAFGLALPLAAVALVHAALAGARLDDALWPLARHGLSRRLLALGALTGAALAVAVVTVPATLLALVIAYDALPGLGRDLLTTSWIALLGAGAYTAWFGLGSTLWRRGSGRWLALAVDFMLGGGTGVLACWLPRSHLDSLIGGPPVLALDQAASSVVLSALALAYLAAALLRTPS